MTAPELKPCPWCRGTDTTIEGKGQIWRGVKGYSEPQYFELRHFGRLSEDDEFPRCNVVFRHRTEAEAIAAWNTRAPDPDLDAHIGAVLEEVANAAREFEKNIGVAGANVGSLRLKLHKALAALEGEK